MANQTVFATSDTDIGSAAPTEGATRVFIKPVSPNDTNILCRFDVSSLAGKMWDSVVLQMTYAAIASPSATGAWYLARVLQAVVYTTARGSEYDTGMAWSDTTNFAEDSVDNDHTTRVDQLAQIASSIASGDLFTSTDITDLVKDGVTKDAGTLDVIFYSAGTGTALTFFSLEEVGPTTQDAQLIFTNVQDMESTATSGTGATNVAVPSASVLSKSGRPPIAGADRQVTATILHDGVEPFTLLSMTVKGEHGTDN